MHHIMDGNDADDDDGEANFTKLSETFQPWLDLIYDQRFFVLFCVFGEKCEMISIGSIDRCGRQHASAYKLAKNCIK